MVNSRPKGDCLGKVGTAHSVFSLAALGLNGDEMESKNALIDFIVSFLLVFVVLAGVTYLWNRVFHAAGAVDWGTSFALAVVLGIALTWGKVRARQKRG